MWYEARVAQTLWHLTAYLFLYPSGTIYAFQSGSGTPLFFILFSFRGEHEPDGNLSCSPHFFAIFLFDLELVFFSKVPLQ
jgi:hypothetical protein